VLEIDRKPALDPVGGAHVGFYEDPAIEGELALGLAWRLAAGRRGTPPAQAGQAAA
jgi:hypothetical protein